MIKQKINMPEWLKQKLSCRETTVVAIGDNESIFAIPAKALGRNEYSVENVQEVIDQLAGLSSGALSKFRSGPETVITRLVLLHDGKIQYSDSGIQRVYWKHSWSFDR